MYQYTYYKMAFLCAIKNIIWLIKFNLINVLQQQGQLSSSQYLYLLKVYLYHYI